MLPPPTKRIFYLIIIFIAIFTPLLIYFNYINIRSEFSSDSSGSTGITNTADEKEKASSKQELHKADFYGLRNKTYNLQKHVIELIEANLIRFNWNKALGMEDLFSLYHETIFAQKFPSDHGNGKSLVVITYTNSTANLYHAARGKISLFEFQQKKNNWQMVRNYAGFAYGDEFGMEPRGLKLVRIGVNNRFGLIVHTGYSNMGHDIESKSVYIEVGQSFKPVFDFTSYEYYYNPPVNIEYTEGHSYMRIVESKKEYFDIETKGEGIEWNDKSAGAVKRFVFNGKEYQEKQENRIRQSY
jgi:hypothetical protein